MVLEPHSYPSLPRTPELAPSTLSSPCWPPAPCYPRKPSTVKATFSPSVNMAEGGRAAYFLPPHCHFSHCLPSTVFLLSEFMLLACSDFFPSSPKPSLYLLPSSPGYFCHYPGGVLLPCSLPILGTNDALCEGRARAHGIYSMENRT